MRNLSPTPSRRLSFHLRLVVLIPAIIGLSAGMLSNSSQSQAQSFFQKLFGTGSSKPVRHSRNRATHYSRRNAQRRRSITALPYGRGSSHSRGSSWRSYNQSFSRRDNFNNRTSRRSSAHRGRYRTYCVRSCDGFYFPVSFGVSRSTFGHDASICRSKCGDSAQLYYSSRHDSPEAMTDLRGRSYKQTETAFLFRKERVKNCQCSVQPWSPSAAAKHEMYALNEPEEHRLARLEGDVEFLAGITKKRKSVIAAEAKAAKQAAIAALAAKKAAKALKLAARAAKKAAKEAKRQNQRNRQLAAQGIETQTTSGRITLAQTRFDTLAKYDRDWVANKKPSDKMGSQTNVELAQRQNLGEPYVEAFHLAQSRLAATAAGRLHKTRKSRKYRFRSRRTRLASSRYNRVASYSRRAKRRKRRRSRSRRPSHAKSIFGGKSRYRWPGD